MPSETTPSPAAQRALGAAQGSVTATQTAPESPPPETKLPALTVPPETPDASTAPGLLKPVRWIGGTTKNEAGRLMPWVFVPPERKYRLYLPAGAHQAARRALVVMIHGCRQKAETFARGTRFNELADQHGFAVLYPNQSELANPQRCWNWFEPRTLVGKGEAAILFSMIDQALRRTQADPERVVIAGLSSGAALAALLAYQQPARFAGIVVHSGLPPHAAHSLRSALDAMRDGAKLDLPDLTQRYWAAQQLPPPPLRVIHGSADNAVHPSNALALFELWASLRQAETLSPLVRARRSVTEAGGRSYESTTAHADGDLVAEHILVQGLGHAWSGGDAALPFNDANAPSASGLIAQWVNQVAHVDAGAPSSELRRPE